MKVHRFVGRPVVPVHAVLVTDENMEEVAVWCGGTIEPVVIFDKLQRAVKVPVNPALDHPAYLTVLAGNWLMLRGDGFFRWLPHHEFDLKYTEDPDEGA